MPGPGLFNFHVARVPALDGVRGIAILLVFAAHSSPVLLSGGKIGVDLFFVLSGFLITSILLQEFRDRGTIHLGYFYMRRALRLLPALFSVIAFVVIFTWITQPSNLPITIWNAIGAMFYFYNWQIFPHRPAHGRTDVRRVGGNADRRAADSDRPVAETHIVGSASGARDDHSDRITELASRWPLRPLRRQSRWAVVGRVDLRSGLLPASILNTRQWLFTG
jgi:hypothetical protein